METTVTAHCGSADHLDRIADETVDLVVTSPPYPMIAMWDRLFAGREPRVATALADGDGAAAFELMHQGLDRCWDELRRVLRPGGIACLNLGDATRSLAGTFALYPNHARVLAQLARLGFTFLPDILWRKQTNAPTKFMGSGMLPVGAHVTYEHEYILVTRKGPPRRFNTEADRRRRRESAFFWEERNLWFSDLWLDLKGTTQVAADRSADKRTAAFPLELACRLVCMFSVKGDTVLDPFVGTGTTLVAAAACGRHGIGVELEPDLEPVIAASVEAMPEVANRHHLGRLTRHVAFAARRAEEGRPLKYLNTAHGFPVMTRQETDLRMERIAGIQRSGPGSWVVEADGLLRLP